MKLSAFVTLLSVATVAYGSGDVRGVRGPKSLAEEEIGLSQGQRRLSTKGDDESERAESDDSEDSDADIAGSLISPTLAPSQSPGPSGEPSDMPSDLPSGAPSDGNEGRRMLGASAVGGTLILPAFTDEPSLAPSASPGPSGVPSLTPSASPGPSGGPSEMPSDVPSGAPSDGTEGRRMLGASSVGGTLILPAFTDDGAPSLAPSASPGPSDVPSLAPSASPAPSGGPSEAPSGAPSDEGEGRRLEKVDTYSSPLQTK